VKEPDAFSEGWWWPRGARKAHFLPVGVDRDGFRVSLCRGWESSNLSPPMYKAVQESFKCRACAAALGRRAPGGSADGQ